MSKLHMSPKYGNAEVFVCYDGISARQRRGLIDSAYKGNRAIIEDDSVYDAESYKIHDLREDFQKWSINRSSIQSRRDLLDRLVLQRHQAG